MGRMLLVLVCAWIAAGIDLSSAALRPGAAGSVMCLAIVCVWCMWLPSTGSALLASAVCGLLLDVQSTTALGLHVVPCVALCWVVRATSVSLVADWVWLRLLWTGGVTFALQCVSWSYLMWAELGPHNEAVLSRLMRIGISCGWTVGAATACELLFWLVARIVQRESLENRGGLGNRWSMLTS